SGGSFVAQNYQLLSIENPEIRVDKLEAARKTEYKSSGRNPFSKVAAPPPVNPGDKQAHNVDPYRKKGPELPPPDPPFHVPDNFKFFGYGTVPNGTTRLAFIADGENVLIVAEGETFQGRFRLVKVNNSNLDVQEVSTGRHDTMKLIEEPAAGGGPT
ncbi:MAG TPA: hypothetical protein VH598_13265, partial [Verrucomicrobiae bacterium]|nr:hypothetical protein [Verrucomicrobiae bacterium]